VPGGGSAQPTQAEVVAGGVGLLDEDVHVGPGEGIP